MSHQIEAILGHELGHWKHSHTLIMMAVSQTMLFVQFYLFGAFHVWAQRELLARCVYVCTYGCVRRHVPPQCTDSVLLPEHTQLRV